MKKQRGYVTMKKDFSVRIKVNCGDTVEVIMRRLKGVFKGGTLPGTCSDSYVVRHFVWQKASRSN